MSDDYRPVHAHVLPILLPRVHQLIKTSLEAKKGNVNKYLN